MATRKLSLSKLLRCRNHTLRAITSSISSSSNLSSPSLIESRRFSNSFNPYLATYDFYRHGNGGGSFRPYKLSLASSCYHSFSTDREKTTDVPASEELSGPGFFYYNYDGGGDWGIAGEAMDATGSVEEAILPVRCLVCVTPPNHDGGIVGGWWMVIITSTLALRGAILPVLLVQLQKLKINEELAPKLPPPLPPPLSGKSWIKQYKLFREKRKEIGCPSLLWILAYPFVQIPCLILGTESVRQMALDHHSGFETKSLVKWMDLKPQLLSLWLKNIFKNYHC